MSNGTSKSDNLAENLLRIKFANGLECLLSSKTSYHLAIDWPFTVSWKFLSGFWYQVQFLLWQQKSAIGFDHKQPPSLWSLRTLTWSCGWTWLNLWYRQAGGDGIEYVYDSSRTHPSSIRNACDSGPLKRWHPFCCPWTHHLLKWIVVYRHQTKKKTHCVYVTSFPSWTTLESFHGIDVIVTSSPSLQSTRRVLWRCRDEPTAPTNAKDSGPGQWMLWGKVSGICGCGNE